MSLRATYSYILYTFLLLVFNEKHNILKVEKLKIWGFEIVWIKKFLHAEILKKCKYEKIQSLKTYS